MLSYERIKRKLGRIFQAFWILFSPFQPFTYLIERWEEAVQPLPARRNPRRFTKKTFHYAVHGLLMVNQFLMLALEPMGTSPRNVQLMVFDMLGLMGLTKIIHVETIGACASLLLLYVYFHNRLHGNRSAREIVGVLQRDERAIIVLGNRWERDRVRERMARAHQALRLIFSSPLGFTTFFYLISLLEHRQYGLNNVTPTTRMLRILLQLSVVCIWTLFFALFCDIGTFLAPVLLGFFTIVQVRVRQCQDRLKRMVRPRLAVVNMVRVRQVNIRTLLFCLHFNGIYGHLLLIFLVGHMPSNGTLLMTMLTGHQPWTLKVGFLVIVLGQYTVIFLLHSFAANVSKLLHSPYKRMMSVNLMVSGMHPVLKIKLMHHVQAMTTKDRAYGITYASFGLISYRTLLKFLLFYGEVLMYNYTTIRGKR